MLKKDIHTIIIGNNYISFLLGFQLRRENRDVLLLNDERVSKNDNHFRFISPMELHYIKTWGHDVDVKHLSNLDEFAFENPFYMSIGQTQLLLGRKNAADNILELYRKFPDVFKGIYKVIKDNGITSEQLNEDYNGLVQRLGKTLSRFKTLQTLNLQTFQNHCPAYINECFEIFHKTINARLENDEGLLAYALRALYHDVLTIKLPKEECFHLFLSLIGPRYRLETSLISEHLKNTLDERDGFYRDSQILEWKFHNGKPWCVQLNTFEGVVHPNKMAFVGGNLESLPIDMRTDLLYSSYHAKLNTKKLNYHKYNHYYFQTENMGAYYPFWIVNSSQDLTTIKIYARSFKCEKADFLRESIGEMLLENKIITSIDQIVELKKGKEVKASGVAKDLNLPEKVVLRDSNDAKKGNELKNVYYIGPCKRGALGLLSSLMETKEFRQFL